MMSNAEIDAEDDNRVGHGSQKQHAGQPLAHRRAAFTVASQTFERQ
jgi:hypothetical protein